MKAKKTTGLTAVNAGTAGVYTDKIVLLSAPNWFVQLRNDAMTSPALRVSEECLQQAVEGFSCSTDLFVCYTGRAQEHQRKPPS